MGFFSGLNDEKYDRQYTDRELTRRIFAYFKPQTKRIAYIGVLVVALAGIGAALPVVVSRMLDTLKNQPTVPAIILVCFIVLLVGIGLWGLNWARRSIVVRAVGDVVLELRTQAFRAAAEHDFVPPQNMIFPSTISSLQGALSRASHPTLMTLVNSS